MESPPPKIYFLYIIMTWFLDYKQHGKSNYVQFKHKYQHKVNFLLKIHAFEMFNHIWFECSGVHILLAIKCI